MNQMITTMTKFEELCESFKKAQSDFQQFKDDCEDFAQELWENMIVYFEIPHTQLSLYKVDEKREWEMVPPMMINAMTLEDDAYWQVGFGITLYGQKNEIPQETLIIGLLLKREDDQKFKVRLYGHDKLFEIDRSKHEDFKEFYDFIFNEIQINYQKELQIFLDKDTTIRKIGYKI